MLKLKQLAVPVMLAGIIGTGVVASILSAKRHPVPDDKT